MDSAALEECLRAGFINYKENNDKRYLPKILTNNSEKKVKVLEPLLFELKKCEDFFFSVAFVTNTGVACLVDVLNDLQAKGIKGKILASQYQNFTEPAALRKLIKFPNLEVRMITESYNFHAKGYLFHSVAEYETEKIDNYVMIIGSSNLTQTALTVNREWNVQLTSLENGALIRQMKDELDRAWNDATCVTDEWIDQYDKIYRQAKSARRTSHEKVINLYKINPNKMQVAALESLENIRNEGKDRALLISATGTGKTYLSAFDVRKVNPKRFLFIVHRTLIANKARESFAKIISNDISTGLFSGNTKERDKDYLFATVQTLSKDENLKLFKPDDFDYIVVDEVHRAGASSYKKILDYFRPKFLLGMTATPERTDGYDIFKLFNYNIAYEIRLNQALSENMLVPFHYHGISEITVDGNVLDDNTDFSKLVCEERVRHVLHYADFYGYDGDRVRGIVFCNRAEEAKNLAEAFCKNGKRAVALTGDTSEELRQKSIARLESDKVSDDNLDYIFAVDVFNEGIDIPSINQIIMLRPTQSAIVFVQQLGRGLRKYDNKRYLEVIDFIGNYENNYLLPVALFGDKTCRKEHVRKAMHNNYLPGASTVYFEDIVKDKIFKSINSGRMNHAKILKDAYELVKFKIGHAPLMMDFVKHGETDPYVYVQKYKSYFEYRNNIERTGTTMNELHQKVLQFIYQEIANGKRLEEIVLLQQLLEGEVVVFDDLLNMLEEVYNVPSSLSVLQGVINVLTMKFYKDADALKYGNISLIKQNSTVISFSDEMKSLLSNDEFVVYLKDALDYGAYTFRDAFDRSKYFFGFKLYENYSRKDVCRILNWEKNEESTMYGYRVKFNTCPIFVTYKKQENISASTMYNDRFKSQNEFCWETRSNVRLDSNEVVEIKKSSTLKLLFIKKDDGEGTDYYFMGQVHLCDEPIQTTKANDNGKLQPIVNMVFKMEIPAEDNMYNYFLLNNENQEIEE